MKTRHAVLATIATLSCGAFFFVLATPSALAGVIRHDRPDDAYRALADGYDSVGMFLGSTGSSRYLGSGTLIADDWVLTAGHNVDSAQSLDFIIGGQRYEAANWIAHPLWDGDLGKGYDIALVQLESTVAGIDPAERFRGSGEAGAIATSVGFGRSGDGLTGATTSAGTKRAGQNTVDRFGRGSGGRILLSDFDDPMFGDAKLLSGDSPALDLEYLIAPGDSGGGLFLDSPSGPLLAGVHSFGAAYDGTLNSDYGDLSGHIRVSRFNDWIDATIGLGASSLTAWNDAAAAIAEPYQRVAGNSRGVPEPSTLALAMLSLLTALAFSRRRLPQ